MHAQRKWHKTKIVATAIVPLLALSQSQGMESTSTSFEQCTPDQTSYKGQFVYRDGLIRRHLDEINMIFKRCGFLNKDGTADLYKIPTLDDKEQRDSIRMTLEKAYLAHLLRVEDHSNLRLLKRSLKNWQGISSIFNPENRDRLEVLFSELLILLGEISEHKNNKKMIRYLNQGDLHWLLSLDERAESEETKDIPKSYGMLISDLQQCFIGDYIKSLPLYKHSVMAQKKHLSIFKKFSKSWRNENLENLEDLFMELVQLKCSLNSVGNAEERRSFGDGMYSWVEGLFTETSEPKPLYCENVRRIKGHIENLQAYILHKMRMGTELIPICEQLQKYGPQYVLRELVGESKEIWILSLDGGGVRGKIAAEILRDLSRQLKEREIDLPLSEQFHFLGGTSVGGLIVLALSSRNEFGKPAFSEEEIADLLEHEQASRIFPPMDQKDKVMGQANSYAYPPEHLEKFLLANFGYGMLLNLGKPTMIMAHNNRTQEPLMLRSYDPKAVETSLMASGRATSAAPTYFPAATLCYDGNLEECVDGGIAVNNPAAECLREVIEILGKRDGPMPRINLLSIGTGKESYEYPHGSFKTGLPGALSNFSEGAMKKMVKEAHKNVLIQLQNLVRKNVEVSYYRINPFLESPIELDNSSPENLSLLSQLVADGVFPNPGYASLVEHFAGDRDKNRNQYIRISGRGDKYRPII